MHTIEGWPSRELDELQMLVIQERESPEELPLWFTESEWLQEKSSHSCYTLFLYFLWACFGLRYCSCCLLCLLTCISWDDSLIAVDVFIDLLFLMFTLCTWHRGQLSPFRFIVVETTGVNVRGELWAQWVQTKHVEMQRLGIIKIGCLPERKVLIC